MEPLQLKNLVQLSQNDYTICIVLLTVLLSFMTHWFTIHSNVFQSWCKTYLKNGAEQFNSIICGRYFGFVVLGVIPLLIIKLFTNYSISSLGIFGTRASLLVSFVWILGLGVIAIFMNWVRRNNSQNLSKYPQIRMRYWNLSHILNNILSWVFYLVGYEILFRGILLFPLYYIFGAWPAIIINVTIYSLAHFPKGFTESLGSIFLGTILCILTLITGTIYIAIGVHVILAISNFLLSLYQHPEMQYHKFKNTAL